MYRYALHFSYVHFDLRWRDYLEAQAKQVPVSLGMAAAWAAAYSCDFFANDRQSQSEKLLTSRRFP